MAAAIVLRSVAFGLTSTEIRHREGIHVAHNLAVREVQAGLAFADKLRMGNHCERGRDAVGKLNIDDLKEVQRTKSRPQQK